MSKAQLIATSGICSAVATVCLLCIGSGIMNFVVLIFAVIACVMVAVPLLIGGNNLVYSLCVYVVSSVLSLLIGLGNALYLLPVILFCMPMAIVKVRAESIKLVATVVGEETLSDPFDQGDDKTVQKVKVDTSRAMPVWLQWLLYYLLLEVSLVATAFVIKVLTPALFNVIASNGYVWLVIVALHLFVIPFNFLLGVMFTQACKVIIRVVKN